MVSGADRDVAAIQAFPFVPTMLDTLCRLTGIGFAIIARVTDDRWVACGMRDDIGFGLEPGSELCVRTTLCREIRQAGGPIVFDDIDFDPIYSGHRGAALYGVKSFIGVPIVQKDGQFFGTLCAVSRQVAQVSRPEILNTFVMFADLIAMHLDTQRRLEAAQVELIEERDTAQRREQFVAVLGHDLRHPLTSIVAGSYLIDRKKPAEGISQLVAQMRNSALRMSDLIDDVLDFARGRLGEGLILTKRIVAIGPVLSQVVAEMETAFPDRTIETVCGLGIELDCDPGRLARLLANLLANAIVHGGAFTPVVVKWMVEFGNFKLSVANAGPPIPVEIQAQLFRPFVRGAQQSDQDGLGLGLYIASMIASAHHGTLSVSSSSEETTFTFEMPIKHGALMTAARAR